MEGTKHDTGKPNPSNCPTQIIHDIMEVQQYGARKYETSEKWRIIDVERWINAFLRHTLVFWENPRAIDKESGIPHYKMMACNLAFVCELLTKEREEEQMMERTLKIGHVYRHFKKGDLYMVTAVALHHETREPQVIYRQLETEIDFVRPLAMFLSEVDKEKYPEATQRYRMEEI